MFCMETYCTCTDTHKLGCTVCKCDRQLPYVSAVNCLSTVVLRLAVEAKKASLFISAKQTSH